MTIDSRQLTPQEILSMQQQGCRTDDWTNIKVGNNFRADRVFNCRFAGNVYIGNNVYISNVGGVLANYIIEDDVYIENVGEIVCSPHSCFGNGVCVVTVNEAGGREVPIFEGLTAQIAYMVAMYRHRSVTIERLKAMISEFVAIQTASEGVIGRGAQIKGCGTIDSVRIGESAVLHGVQVLSNGTVCSSAQCPTRIGHGVVIYDFVTAEGATVDNGAILKRCFIGEAVNIDSGFSGVDTLFFANCDFANGEACSVFAGPYTVSHHKSSLLIAGLFSFFNAGSGANQSNHLFKTGAVHQAIHERGCKYSSNGYIMAPAKTGAFNVVLGGHTGHHNTEDFPFSYLVESDGKSFLLPANNLRSYGLMRDIAKWPLRDKRCVVKGDLINFEQYNPYIGERLVRAVCISDELLAKEGVDVYNYGRVRIKSAMLRRGVGLYRMALNATVGAILADGRSEELDGRGAWIDMSGMYAPKSAVSSLLDKIDGEELTTLTQIKRALVQIADSYRNYAYSWALDSLSPDVTIEQAIVRGETDRVAMKELTDADALHDGDILMSTGYGIDATDKQEIADDFAAVRHN